MPTPFPRRESSLPDDCLFCSLYREGDHVASTEGFVAIHDINPKADVHLLVIPERHVETFRDVAQFTPDETKRMLEFIADTAATIGLEEYRVLNYCGAGVGQTVFHLHWHLLGGTMHRMPA